MVLTPMVTFIANVVAILNKHNSAVSESVGISM